MLLLTVRGPDRVVIAWPFRVQRMVVYGRVGWVCMANMPCGKHAKVGLDGVVVVGDERVMQRMGPCVGRMGEVAGIKSL
jgi:hypothetical protein